MTYLSARETAYRDDHLDLLYAWILVSEADSVAELKWNTRTRAKHMRIGDKKSSTEYSVIQPR